MIYAFHAICGLYGFWLPNDPRGSWSDFGHLKGRATQELKAQKLWTNEECNVWADQCWKVYLETLDYVANAIHYVEGNPRKEGLPPQKWNCVTPFPYEIY